MLRRRPIAALLLASASVACAASLQSAYQHYDLPLTVARNRDAKPLGWTLPLRINGGHPLRILFDTGAQGLLISKPCARRLRLEPGTGTTLGGFGNSGAVRGETALAASVSAGGLEFAGVPVTIAPGTLPGDVDGLAGPELFRDFEITISGPARTLSLRPFDSPQPAAEQRTLARAGHLLIARANLGNFVIDSGASVSVVGLREKPVAARPVSLEGLSGLTDAYRLDHPVRLEIGGTPFTLSGAVATDLTGLSEHFGIQLDGLIGFPVLARSVTTLDLRHGTLSIAETRR